MNSTEDERDILLREFYARHLLPLSEGLKERGVSFFPHGPDPEEGTYYVERREVSDYLSEFDEADMAMLLAERWEREGLTDLAGIARALADLAQRLDRRDAEAEEVSPFIYAMF